MTLYQFVLAALLVGLCNFVHAQNYTSIKTANKKQQKIFTIAKDDAFSIEYEKALKDLEKLLNDDATFIDAWILKGQILFDQRRLEEAKAAFHRSLEIDKNYNDLVHYMMGVTHFRMDEYAESLPHFKNYVSKNPRDQRRLNRAKQYIERADFAAKLVANPVPFDPQPLSAAINTAAPEYLPSLTADGELFIFTRQVNRQEDFYVSKKENGEFLPAKAVKRLNTPQNEGAQTVSADGRLLVFGAGDRKDTYGGFDLYFSEFRDGQFTPPINLGSNINTRARDRQPSLSSNGNTLYFESARSGGLGGSDIWMSERQPDGNWSKAQNLGDIINTSADDQAPFIHADGKTLYFMSKGHLGMGGFDLFMSQKQADGTWSKPKNLGYPINTKANQGALIVSLDGKTAYYTSDQAPPEYGGREDIYTFELPEQLRPKTVTYVKAVVKDAKTKQRIKGAEAEFITLSSAASFVKSYTNYEGVFLTVLPAGEEYALNVNATDYAFHSENFVLDETENTDKPFELEIFLTPIPKPSGEVIVGRPIVLKNIFFETNKATLLPKSKVELQRLKALLERHLTMHIQLNGHTDDIGSDEDNLLLSEARAKAVYDYLIAEGINASRLKYKGFGESQPINTNDTAEGRQNNRRTEFVIIK